MKKYLSIISIFAVIFFSCNSNNENSEATDSTLVADAIKTPVLKINEFDSLAGNYVDKQIQVKGIVDHVCKHGGKRLFLVGDGGELHVDGEERFNDSLMGSEITITGIVREFRVDEAYCLKMEEDNIKSHSKGQTEKDLFEQKQKHIAEYRDSMKTAHVDHLSFYSLEYLKYK